MSMLTERVRNTIDIIIFIINLLEVMNIFPVLNFFRRNIRRDCHQRGVQGMEEEFTHSL